MAEIIKVFKEIFPHSGLLVRNTIALVIGANGGKTDGLICWKTQWAAPIKSFLFGKTAADT